ncbi:hypothetical protein [Listeria grandensis]|uniref:hypothetical protein n=1 Tax=Listeria grandensis TaxID=1494963 RepID=UPI00164E56F7|nr:hypothetical protein [Listeria grandensis]MBC6314455.1 hypothetical protein [Listeria grandensis]
MKKVLVKRLIIGVLSVGVVLSPFASQYSGLSTPVSASTTVFQETFDAGLLGWSYDYASVGTVNGNKYIHIQSGENTSSIPGSGVISDIGFIERDVPGVSNGQRYKVTFRASGVGNVSINNADYIRINTGSVNMNSAQTYSYEGVSNKNVINIFAITLGSTMGIDDIKIEAL